MCTSANYRLTNCHPFALEQKLYMRTPNVVIPYAVGKFTLE